MKTSAEPTPSQQSTARLTAWAVEELTSGERSDFAVALATDPALQAEAAATRVFCHELQNELSTAPASNLQLNKEAKARLQTAARSTAKRPLSLWMPSLAAAACFAVMLGVYFQARRKDTTPLSPQNEFLAKLEKSQFFLTHKFNSPELTVQGAPRTSMYPVDADAPTPNYAPATPAPVPYFDYLEAEIELEFDGQSSKNTALSKKRLLAGTDLYFVDAGVPALRRVGEPDDKGEFRFTVEYNFGDDPALSAEKLSAASYRSLPENSFLTVLEQPLSTFSIDVDTASYAIVRRHLNQGQRPPVEAVRLEEMINYFPMDDAPPVDGKPFAVHVETAAAPWAKEHRVVRVALKGRTIAAAERAPASLVFLVDTSGSMAQPNKLPLVQQSLQLLLAKLESRDRVAIVSYAGESRVVLPSTPLTERTAIAAAIDSLSSGGSTNGSGGITAAYETARANFIPGGVNRVILATDGDFNVGLTDHEELQTLITREAKSGVYLSVLAYGSDNLKDTTAELLADKGNGNYAYIDSLSEARRALVGQLEGTLVTIAKDVKIQVEFNPAKVARYRLLGYENRALANKDFNDDSKDAGEIGAGHSVTALYEIVPAGAPDAVVSTTDPLKYQVTDPTPAAPSNTLTAQAATGELLTVKLRYQQPEGTAPSQLIEVAVKDPGTPWDQASANFRWTAAVAGYGLLLRNSQHAGNLNWDTIRQLATGAKGPDPDGFRGEFLQLVEKAAGILSNK